MKDIFIYNWWNKNFDEINMPAQQALFNYLFTENEQGDYFFINYQVPKDGLPEGYSFGIKLPVKLDDPKGRQKVVFFRFLPVNATIDQIKSVINKIVAGDYKYIENSTDESGIPSQPDQSIITIEESEDELEHGGFFPIDVLPEWLNKLLDNIFGSLGLDGLRIPWWLFAAIAAYATTKTIQKNSNKVMWGAISAFNVYAAFKRYKQSKQVVKTV